MTDSRNERDEKPMSRFTYWFVLTGFSVVVLVDLATTKRIDRSRADKWAMTVACISLSLGTLSILAHALVRDRFVGTPVEGGMIILCLGFWAAGLSSIMNPTNDIAVTSGGALQANIYFFSWGSFGTALMLAGTFSRDVLQMQRPQNIPRRALWWLGLSVASIVVMCTSSRFFHNDAKLDCELDSPTCPRVKFGISLGVVSSVIAVLVGLALAVIPVVIETAVALVMMILWCFGVAYLTFGTHAPASNVGNFYFSTWSAFIISLILLSDSASEAYESARGNGSEQTTTGSTEAQPKV